MQQLQQTIKNIDNMATRELSPYKIYWAEFFPTTGRYVTKKDINALGEYVRGWHFKTYRKWFGSKEKAVQFLTNFNKKLTKRYKVLLCTDKQFGMTKQEEGYAIHYTKKQLQEVYYVG